jgi:hypothetical protein
VSLAHILKAKVKSEKKENDITTQDVGAPEECATAGQLTVAGKPGVKRWLKRFVFSRLMIWQR